jgi:hypothetical protein
MKKLLAILVGLLVLPIAFAVDTGAGIGLDITTEEFPPHIWMCDSRVVLDDCVESGRISDCNKLEGNGVPEVLKERTQNYAFEGEQIAWKVLVMDKNKIEQIDDVVATLGTQQGEGNLAEVECSELNFADDGDKLLDSCNARLGEEKLYKYDSDTMDYYKCILTVETQDSMWGEYFITIEAISGSQSATIDENEYWFLNPEVGLLIDGSLSFSDVRPGTVAYSDTVLVRNDAQLGSGVMLDMFISGTDFYDPASSGAKCPTSNRLKLSHDGRSQESLGADTATNAFHAANTCGAGKAFGFNAGLTADNADHLCYYATNGAYSTFNGAGLVENADAEGYRPIVYSDVFTRDFYNDAEIIENAILTAGYSAGNVLAPGAEMAVTFKLGLPEPCVGDFSDGDVFFWGEAV